METSNGQANSQRSEIYLNAIDSLQVGIDYFMRDSSYSSRKHAIMTVFHAIELFLKERLYRVNPALIYRDIDKPIKDDSITVGAREALNRLDNLGLGLHKQSREAIEKMQGRRNRIEHHRYDHKGEDEQTLSESLAFILFFVGEILDEKLADDLTPERLRAIQDHVYDRRDLYWIASHRLERWMHQRWPQWHEEEADTPDEFRGTLDCPLCRQEFLVIGYHDKPFCFCCNTDIDAAECDCCGRTHLADNPCCEYDE